MIKDSIFYSDDEQSDFRVASLKGLASLQADDQAYISSMIDSKVLQQEQSPIKQMNIVNNDKKAKKVKNTKINKVTQPSQTSISAQNNGQKVSQDLDSNQGQGSDFMLNLGQNPPKNKKVKPRSSDQNICKKCHTFANKILRKLGLYKFISPYIDKIYKRNYFLIALIIAQKSKKLNEFTKMYFQKVEQVILNSQKIIKSSFKGSKQSKKNKQLKGTIFNSLDAIALYQDEKVLQALQKLYDLKKMKRTDWFQQSHRQILKIGQTIRIN